VEAAAEVAVEAVASVVATVMVAAAAVDSAEVVAVATVVVAAAEDSVAVTVEAAAEVDSVAAVGVAAAVPCVEAVEADTETVPTKHPPLQACFKKTQQNHIQEACHTHHKNFYKVATPPQTIFKKKKPSPTFSNPCFFSAAVEMSDQYFIT